MENYTILCLRNNNIEKLVCTSDKIMDIFQKYIDKGFDSISITIKPQIRKRRKNKNDK